jgi:hypothetical protein
VRLTSIIGWYRGIGSTLATIDRYRGDRSVSSAIGQHKVRQAQSRQSHAILLYAYISHKCALLLCDSERKLFDASAAAGGGTLLHQFQAIPADLTAAQYAIIRQLRHKYDYHNNYGCDFIPTSLLDKEYEECVKVMAKSGPQEMQSGPGTDDGTYANKAWEDAVAKCMQLFRMHLLVVTSHASDLLQYVHPHLALPSDSRHA